MTITERKIVTLFLEQLKNGRPNIKVIVRTIYSTENNRSYVYKVINDYLRKKFLPD